MRLDPPPGARPSCPFFCVCAMARQRIWPARSTRPQHHSTSAASSWEGPPQRPHQDQTEATTETQTDPPTTITLTQHHQNPQTIRDLLGASPAALMAHMMTPQPPTHLQEHQQRPNLLLLRPTRRRGPFIGPRLPAWRQRIHTARNRIRNRHHSMRDAPPWVREHHLYRSSRHVMIELIKYQMHRRHSRVDTERRAYTTYVAANILGTYEQFFHRRPRWYEPAPAMRRFIVPIFPSAYSTHQPRSITADATADIGLP